MPFAAADAEAPSKTATAAPAASPEVQIVKAAEQTAAPAATVPADAAPVASTAAPAKPSKVAGTPTLVTPNAITTQAGKTTREPSTD